MQLSNENYNNADNSGGDRVAIVGLGLIGGSLARRLSMRGCSVTAFDIDSKRYRLHVLKVLHHQTRSGLS